MFSLERVAIAVAGAVLYSALLFFGGCHVGTQRGLDKASDEVDAAQSARDAAIDSAAAMRNALDAVNAQATLDAEEARKWRVLADKAVQAAQAATDAVQSDRERYDRDLARAAREPSCAAQLEAPLCAPLH